MPEQTNRFHLSLFATGLRVLKKNYKKYSLHFNKRDFKKSKFKNRLIICNHEFFPLDIIFIPYLLGDYFKLPISIVVGRDTDTGKLCEEIFENQELIFTGNATEKVIDALNRGRSVVMFVSIKREDKFFSSTSLQVIYEATKCSSIYLTTDSMLYSKYVQFLHPWLYLYATNMVRKCKNTITKEEFEKEARIIASIATMYQAMIFGKDLDLYFTCSKRFRTIGELIKNRSFLKELFIREAKSIDTGYYDKTIQVDDDIAEMYCKLFEKGLTDLRNNPDKYSEHKKEEKKAKRKKATKANITS